MVKQIIDREWSPTLKWVATLGASALLILSGYVAIGATKGYKATDDICRIEKKVDAQTEQANAQRERLARIEAMLENITNQMSSVSKKLDRRMNDKHIDNR